MQSESTKTQEKWVGVKAMAEALGVSPKTLTRWRNSGIVPAIRIGKTVRFEPAKVKTALVDNFEVKAYQPPKLGNRRPALKTHPHNKQPRQ